MTWEDILKGRTIQYSGTCSKCKEFKRSGDECSLKLPAQGETPAPPYCPMKVNQ